MLRFSRAERSHSITDATKEPEKHDIEASTASAEWAAPPEHTTSHSPVRVVRLSDGSEPTVTVSTRVRWVLGRQCSKAFAK
jgi:hypothetical protein